MRKWLVWSKRIDQLVGIIGRSSSWLVVVMVLLGAFNAVGRFLGRFLGTNLSSNAYIELQWYLFSLVFLLGGAHALRTNSHVRVDVLSSWLGARKRAWIDLLGTVIFLMPFCLFSLWVSWPSVASSWRVQEGSPDPGGLPRYPIKTAILVCFLLLLLQGISEAIKRIAALRGVLPLEPLDEQSAEGDP